MSNQSLFQVGDKCIAFDSNTWMKTGDVGNNKIFWKPATVINICRRIQYGWNEWLADVQFEGGKISHGHFQRCLMEGGDDE